MLYLLLLATLSVALAEEPVVDQVAEPAVQADTKADESAIPIQVFDHHDERHQNYRDGLELMRSRTDEDNQRHHHQYQHHGEAAHQRHGHHGYVHTVDDYLGPVVLRQPFLHRSHEHPDIERQNKIIEDVYSPDFYQPTWILDYRYLKTGGRDYTRGPGGQIIILPRGIHTKEHKEFSDYDMLLEHLRLSRIAEREARKKYHSEAQHQHAGHGHHHSEHGHAQEHHEPENVYYGHTQRHNDGHRHHGHNQNDWERKRH